jgi:hypothetical protein
VEQIENIIKFPSQTINVITTAKNWVSKMDWKVVERQWLNLLR